MAMAIGIGRGCDDQVCDCVVLHRHAGIAIAVIVQVLVWEVAGVDYGHGHTRTVDTSLMQQIGAN